MDHVLHFLVDFYRAYVSPLIHHRPYHSAHLLNHPHIHQNRLSSFIAFAFHMHHHPHRHRNHFCYHHHRHYSCFSFNAC
jgi:hypothetical protein